MDDVAAARGTEQRAVDRRAIPSLAVVIPARNEQERLPRCLHAVFAAEAVLQQRMSDAPPIRVVVVLDSCTDGSRAIVENWPRVEVLNRKFGLVGAARAAGVEHVLATPHLSQPDWIACTDADSAVPTEWLVQQMKHASADTDLLLGVVRPDAQELQPSSLNRWISQYHFQDGHPHIHGANMGVRAEIYRRAGGFPALPEHEDVVLVQRIRSLGGRIVSTGGEPVLTSARTEGRTPGGMAGYLAKIATSVVVD